MRVYLGSNIRHSCIYSNYFSSNNDLGSVFQLYIPIAVVHFLVPPHRVCEKVYMSVLFIRSECRD